MPAAGLVAKGQAGDNAAPLSITEISNLLKRTVEDRFGFVRLRGELSGVKRAASGHLYCCLKDEGAVIDGVMWRTGTQRLGFVPEDGIEVVASGKLTTYPGRSKYQIVIETMEVAGEGALLAHETEARIALPVGAFAIAIDIGAIALAGFEEVELQCDIAGIAIVDRADEPVHAATLLARDRGVLADRAGQQATLVPVDRDVLDELECIGSRRVMLG